jgi:RNase adaptor protein for sRNA GlmZ degradation
MSSGKEFDTFVEHSINFASVLEKESKELGYHIIDTTELSPEEVSKKVVEWLQG